MRVFATRLGAVLSITFVDDGDGWQFGSWTTVTDRVPSTQPDSGDRDRRFAEIRDAVTYFRSRYGDVADAVNHSSAAPSRTSS
jgi:hypothetical protein